jgi:beta-glucanase (GH16 family)
MYLGVPGGESSQVAQWVPSMCTFSGGEAHFMASGIDSCGMKYRGGPQKYGAWFARLKGDDEPSGMLFSDIFLLWPADNQWPPEIDVYEDRGDRSRTDASLINTVGDACGSAPTLACLGPYEQTNGPAGGVANSDTEWHTYGVEWTPSGVSWLIDGHVIFTAPASQVKSPAQQPALPMDMALQSQNLQGAGTPTPRETMTVDWVEQFSWNG